MSKLLRAFWRVITAPFRFIFWVFRAIFRWFRRTIGEVSEFLSEEPEDSPLPEAMQKAITNPMAVLSELNVLRKHLTRAVIFLLLTTAISFMYTEQIMTFMAQPIEGGLSALRAIDPTEPVGTYMKVALLTGFSLAFPYIALELWLFAAPGLHRNARFITLAAIPIATLFFIGGMAFVYWLMLKPAMEILLNFGGLTTQLRPSSYFNFLTSLMFWMGAFFQFPLVVYVLARIGVLKAKMLASQWRIAVVIMAIAAAMITPTVDPINMGIVMGPMLVLYFLGTGLAYLAQRNREKVSQE